MRSLRVALPCLLLTPVMLLGACAGQDTVAPLPFQDSAPPSQVTLSLLHDPGLYRESGSREVTVGVRWEGGERPPGGLQASLVWDPATVTFLGQIPQGETLVLLEEEGLARNEAAFLAVNPWGLPRDFAFFAFRVVGPATSPVQLRVEEAALLDLSAPTLGTGGEVPVSDLPAPQGARPMGERDWTELLGARYGGGGGLPSDLQRVPGGGQIFGDANEDGLVNFSDVLATGRMAQGLEECFIGSVGSPVAARDCIAGNVFPFNLPGLGELSDPCPPGLDVCGTLLRTVNSSDVVAIARDAVGIDQPVVREAIPGQGAPLGTADLSGVITGTRTLVRDTLYVLQGVVTVGDEAGAPGELVIAPDTRIEGNGAASALVISRNGRILAQGTQFEPIAFACHTGSAPGCWRGLIVNGNGSVNTGAACPSITGRTGAGCLQLGGGTEGGYGGCEPADSSGALSWIRVLDAGAGDTPALDLRAVGSRTRLSQLYSVRSGGDGVRVRGGTVDLRYVRVVQPEGSGFSWDDGWRGRFQYGVVQAGSGTNEAMAGSNSATNFNALPRSAPEIRNVSLVGPPSPADAQTMAGSIRLTNGTAGLLQSFLFLTQPFPDRYVLDIDEDATVERLGTGELRVDSSLVVGYAQLGSLDPDPPLTPYHSPDVEGQYLRGRIPATHLSAAFAHVDSILRGPWSDLPDLRLLESSLTALTCPASQDPFFEAVTFCGATGIRGYPWGSLPWYEPAPPVPFVRVVPDPEPALLVIQVRAQQGDVPLPGVVFKAPYRGVTALDGYYRAYVSPGNALLTYEHMPFGCSVPPDVIVVENLQPREVRAFAITNVPCS